MTTDTIKATSTYRALDTAIEQMEDAFKHVSHARDSITLEQYRRLRTLRHKFADMLVESIKADPTHAKPEIEF